MPAMRASRWRSSAESIVNRLARAPIPQVEGPMTVQRFYRAMLWLPIVVPAGLIAVFIMAGWGAADAGGFTEAIAWSLIVGGLPYAALALWANFWMDGRDEHEIRRLMFVSPLLMVGAFAVYAALLGALEGRSLRSVGALAWFGGSYVIPFGYAYVGIALLLRRVLRPQLVGPVSRSV
jgi:hypothetical protein